MNLSSKLLFIVLSLMNYQVFSQNTFVRSYNSSFQQKGILVFESGDNFLFVTDLNSQKANSSFIKLLMVDAAGNTLFNKLFSLPDKCYVITGVKSGNSFILAINYNELYKNRSTLLKIDSNLNEVWRKTISDAAGEILITSIKQSHDNSILISGNCKSSSKEHRGFFIQKLNSSGEIIWYKEFNAGKNSFVSALHENDDGTFLICGEVENPNSSRTMSVCQTDSKGENPIFRYFAFSYSCGARFITTYNNNYVVGGYSNDAGRKNSDGVVLFLDQNLDSTSSYTFDMGLNERISSYTKIFNELIVVGNTQDFTSEYGDVFILKFDKNNSFINHKLI